MTKGPLNYTTTIDAGKTASQCVDLLATHGASAVALTYSDRRPTGLTFRILTVHGDRNFSMPINIEGIHRLLLAARRKGTISPRFAERDQAERVAWRVLKDWLEVQLVMIEAGVVNLDEAMLPYLNVAPGVTLYQRYLENERLAIETGDQT